MLNIQFLIKSRSYAAAKESCEEFELDVCFSYFRLPFLIVNLNSKLSSDV